MMNTGLPGMPSMAKGLKLNTIMHSTTVEWNT